jgi:uncharacterized caspase-like protein
VGALALFDFKTSLGEGWDRSVVAAFLSFLFAFLATSVSAERRLALVVGIDAYENITPLQKAGNDARAVAQTLESLDFEVTALLDPTRRDMNRAIAQFTFSIEPGDVVVFFFAGHGIGMDGRNYLLPADVPEAGPSDKLFIASESIAADQLTEAFNARGARLTFLILDACRNNPFPRDGTRSLGATRGLMRMDPAEGTFVLFSAGTGQTALDRLSNTDPDPNSVFTRSLLPRLTEPGLSVHDLVREVRSDVRDLAALVNHDQFPAYYDQLTGDFSFNPDMTPDPPLNSTPAASAPAVENAPDPCGVARADWAILQNSNSAAALRQFTEAHSACPIFVAAAQDRLASLSATVTSPAPAVDVVVPQAPARELNSCEGLWYARNLIFHDYGYCFQSNRAKSVFDTSSCTTRTPALSRADTLEVDRLAALERGMGC